MTLPLSDPIEARIVSFADFADRRTAPSPASTRALARAVAEIEAAGRRSTHATVKALARNYIRHPLLLDHVHYGASQMSLRLLYRRLELRLAFHRSANRFGACLQQPMNIKAAMLAARYILAKERGEFREAAE